MSPKKALFQYISEPTIDFQGTFLRFQGTFVLPDMPMPRCLPMPRCACFLRTSFTFTMSDNTAVTSSFPQKNWGDLAGDPGFIGLLWASSYVPCMVHLPFIYLHSLGIQTRPENVFGPQEEFGCLGICLKLMGYIMIYIYR